MVNFPTRIPDCDCYSPAFLDFFLSDTSIYSTVASLHLETLNVMFSQFSLTFRQTRDVHFHITTYDYSHTDQHDPLDHLRDVPWEDIFQLCAPAAATEFCELVQVRIDVCIVTFRSSVISHRNHFFRLHQQNKSSASKVNFREGSNRCKLVLEAGKLMLNKARVYYFPETWFS